MGFRMGRVSTFNKMLTMEKKSNLNGEAWVPVPKGEIEQNDGLYRHFAPYGMSSLFFRLAVGSTIADALHSVRVYQESLIGDTFAAPFSDHGRLDIFFNGELPGIRYLNFNFEGKWVIQNMPVTPLEESKTEKISFGWVARRSQPLYVGSRDTDLQGGFLSFELRGVLRWRPVLRRRA